MIVLAALPALTIVFVWVALRSSRGRREALLDAAVIGGVLVTICTEGLSLFGQLKLVPLIFFWTVAAVAAGALALRRTPPTWPLRLPTVARRYILASSPFAVVLTLTLLVAVVAPPNTWDSMTYHMARVAHWIDLGSVYPYPTETVRQLYLPPWSEFAIANLQVLTGGDRLANLVQWLAMATSLVGVSLLASELGASPRGQYLAAAIAATLPMGIMQATSTQNDYVESLWLVCVAFYAIRLRTLTWWSVLGFGASLGLAVLTKGTAYVFGLALIVLVGWWLVAQRRLAAWKPALVIALLVLAINAGAWTRNIAVFASPLGPDQHVINQVFSPSALLSNLVRDVAAQVGTPSRTANLAITHAIADLHRVLDIGPSDPRTTWTGAEFQVNLLRPDEDTTPDPVQLLLFLVAAFVCVVRWTQMRAQALYLGCWIAAFLAFAFVLKWQPWHSRLELPLMVLASPLIATVLSVRWPSTSLTTVLTTLLLVSAVPWLLGPTNRPLLGTHSVLVAHRDDAYFFSRPELERSYRQAADQAHAQGCHVVGIDGTEDTWEYPLWVYLGDGYRVVAVSPAYPTARLGPPATPCFVFKPA